MAQKRTFDTPRHQCKVTLTRRNLTVTQQVRFTLYRPVATRKPGSTEIVCGTFQTKSAENGEDEHTQSAHVRNPWLALYTTVGCTCWHFSSQEMLLSNLKQVANLQDRYFKPEGSHELFYMITTMYISSTQL